MMSAHSGEKSPPQNQKTHKARTALSCALLALSLAAPAHAAPPLITDDAGTVEVGKVEIESNNSYSHDSEHEGGVKVRGDVFDTELKVTTGLYKDLGIALAVPYVFSDRTKEDGHLVDDVEGFGDMTLEVKYRFLELAGIDFTIKPYVLIPTGRYNVGLSEGSWQPGVTLIATREFHDGDYALHANVGYEHHHYRTDDMRGTNRNNLWSGSLAGEAKLLPGLIGVADFGLATTQDKGTDTLTSYALTGVRYEVNEYLDVDAGVKFGLTKPEDDLAVLYGIVLKF
jgi:outer membrane receptor protein involved in Fe transport